MKSEIIITLIFALCLTVAVTARSDSYYSETKPANLTKEKKTRVHFYLHDMLSGQNPTAVRIAHANFTSDETDSPVRFGSLFAMDDPLTVGPEKNSTVIGNGRGMYLSASKEISKFTIVMYADLAFTTGRFKGSSISVFSRNPVAEEGGEREIAIVGGRGKFRMARGFVKIKTHRIDMNSGDAVLRYDATVYHY